MREIGIPAVRPSHPRATSLRTRLSGAALVLILHAALLLILTWPPALRHAPQDLGRSVVPMTIYNLRMAMSAPHRPQKDIPVLAKQTPAPTQLDSQPPTETPLAEPNPAPELADPSLVTNPEPVADASPPLPDLSVTSFTLAGGEKCDLVPALKDALEASASVATALRLIPHQSRSVANAIMLWNGTWVDAAALGGNAAMVPIRTALVNAVGTAPPACLLETMAGPRLILISDTYGTLVLAVGSGNWHWMDLLYDTAPEAP